MKRTFHYRRAITIPNSCCWTRLIQWFLASSRWFLHVGLFVSSCFLYAVICIIFQKKKKTHLYLFCCCRVKHRALWFYTAYFQVIVILRLMLLVFCFLPPLRVFLMLILFKLLRYCRNVLGIKNCALLFK